MNWTGVTKKIKLPSVESTIIIAVFAYSLAALMNTYSTLSLSDQVAKANARLEEYRERSLAMEQEFMLLTEHTLRRTEEEDQSLRSIQEESNSLERRIAELKERLHE